MANVPVDWVSPRKRKNIKTPDPKTPTKITNPQEEKDVFLISRTGAPLKYMRVKIIVNISETRRLWAEKIRGLLEFRIPTLSTIPKIPKLRQLIKEKMIP